MDKLFVIAIGGTGMRCLESFVHLCAIGMFDNQTIDILTLDTDQNNGNKGRVETLIDLYNKVKSNDENNIDGGQPNANTFFSAKLKLSRFFTKYTEPTRKTYKVLSASNVSTLKTAENQDLSDLFFDRNTVQAFNLERGYRAQTHLGSMLMYHGIIDAARNVARNGDNASVEEKELKAFIEELQNNQGHARVFVFGSVFGGTGASSIPVIPVALQDAVSIYSGGANTLDTMRVKFASTLLTNYFSFSSPDAAQKNDAEDGKVIADSNNFALNSQAALQFYETDPTVKKTYRRFYHIGWPFKTASYANDGRVITGGAEQKNACHVAELLCACSAYDFFTLEDDKLNNGEANYYYRTVNVKDDGNLELKGSDFIDKGGLLENKLGSFFSFAHIVLSQYEAAWSDAEGTGVRGLLSRFSQQNIKDYEGGISPNQARQIDEYLKAFGYKFDERTKNMEKGWIYQVHDSVPGTFIFLEDAFKTRKDEMKKVCAGQLFANPSHNWSQLTGVFSKTDNSVDVLIKNMNEEKTRPNANQNVASTKEKFLAHIYNAISAEQKFDKL